MELKRDRVHLVDYTVLPGDDFIKQPPMEWFDGDGLKAVLAVEESGRIEESGRLEKSGRLEEKRNSIDRYGTTKERIVFLEQEVIDDVTVDIGEPEVPTLIAIRQACVVNAKQIAEWLR